MCRASSLAWPRFSLRRKPFQAAFQAAFCPCAKLPERFWETPQSSFCTPFPRQKRRCPLPAGLAARFSGRNGMRCKPFISCSENPCSFPHSFLHYQALAGKLGKPAREAKPRAKGDGNGGSMTAMKWRQPNDGGIWPRRFEFAPGQNQGRTRPLIFICFAAAR